MTKRERALRACTADELRALILDGAAAVDDFAAFLDRRLSFREAPESGPALIQAAVTAALAIESVGWEAIDAFTKKLDALILDIRALGRSQPALAAVAAEDFLRRLPAVFDRLNCAEEMARFSERLAAALLRLAGDAAIAPVLDAFEHDEHGHFHGLLDVLAAEIEAPTLLPILEERAAALEARGAAYEAGAMRRVRRRLLEGG